jgi:hypothetical protein
VKKQRSWLVRLIELAVVALTVAAVVHELRQPRAERTWHGRVAKVPYDFRLPSPARIRGRLWQPSEPAVLVPRSFGLGWTVNFGSVVARRRPQRSRPS